MMRTSTDQNLGRSGLSERNEAPPATRSGRRARGSFVTAILAAALIAAVTLSVSVGPVGIGPAKVWGIILHHLFGLGDPSSWTPVQDNIVWDLRLPRALLGVLVGAGLTVVGIVVQALVRNPLADPYLLGISEGAAVGAVAFIVWGFGAFGVASTAGAAFIGALGSFILVYLLAFRSRNLTPLRLILAGVAVGYALQAIAHFMVLQADNPGQTNAALFWLLGSLAKARWSYLGVPAAVVGLASVLLMGQARALNALAVGDETAASLGIGVERLRRSMLALASLVIGVVVALSGSIGFVGLVVPHLVRLLVGADHRRLLPAGLVGGATFLVVVDVVARMALRPQEVPIGIVTAVLGAPMLMWLMSRRSEVG
jgi:iron complex transport system permease protein